MRNAWDDAPYSRVRAAWRISVILLWTTVLLLPSLTLRLLTGRAPMAINRLWYRGSCRLLGLEVEATGRPDTARSVLFVANHVSYLDILILGSLLKVRFIAKSEVRSWPGIGPLAAHIGTLFIERRARRSRKQRDLLSASLADGDNLVLFPEGTSSDGSRVLPFKSSLFSVFEKGDALRDVAIQPITIDYARFSDGTPIEGEGRDLYAWHGDMTLIPHLYRVFGLKGAKIGIVLHDVIRPVPSVDRKTLAKMAEQTVAKGLEDLRGGSGKEAPTLTAGQARAA
jgi:1-acyl-sn-glycerol-3-phosphate acyltransferase